MIDKKNETKNIWEVPNIDLNLRHYSGSVSDVFKKIKNDIVNYLSKPNINPKSREIYSAIYNALNYYEMLSPEFPESSTFLQSSLEIFNEDFEYLSQKYTSDDPFDLPVVSLSARVKSPLSFVEKVKNKVNEYLNQDRDFSYFNESLRDIIGVRVVIDPPSSVKSQGLQAESDYLYNAFFDLMTFRGILDDSDSVFKFLDVNTRYDKTKLEKIKNSTYSGKFILSGSPLTDSDKLELDNYNCIVIPQSRPEFMEKIDSKVKDYRLYPKKSGYQSLHICVTPSFANLLDKKALPDCILPSKASDYSIEYQFRNVREDEFSRLGPASHGKLKPFEKVYHRLAIPSFIDNDNSRKILVPRNFGENYQQFYGPSFEDRFNIPYPLFVSTFDEATQNEILAEKKEVSFNDFTQAYCVSNAEIPLCVDKDDAKSIKTPFKLIDLLERLHVSDATIVPTELVSGGIINGKTNPIKLYKFIVPVRVVSRQSKDFTSPNGHNFPGLDDDL